MDGNTIPKGIAVKVFWFFGFGGGFPIQDDRLLVEVTNHIHSSGVATYFMPDSRFD